MIILTGGGVQLEEGEEFVEEVQAPGNIMRVGTYNLATGMHILVERHFSQIGPCIKGPDGKRIETAYDRETNSVREIRKE